MPALRRARISCFYCGIQSRHRKSDGINSFQCENCEGTNHLDKNGDIVDVPSSAIGDAFERPKKFATANQMAESSPPSANRSSIFCKRCVQNQQILTNLLANYLPAESDPRYAEYEAKYEEYKKGLEQRYPQVCPACEPKVLAALRRTAYDAKSKNMSDKTRLATPVRRPSFSLWRIVLLPILMLSEAVSCAALIFNALWHILVLLDPPPPSLSDSEDISIGSPHAVPCLVHGLSSMSVDDGCWEQVSLAVLLALGVETSIIWWNPAMIRFRGRSTVNKAAFYQLRVLCLALRCGIWYLTTRVVKIGASSLPAAHAAGIVICIADLVKTYTTIRIAPRPQFQYRALQPTLLNEDAVYYPYEPQQDGNMSPSVATPTRFKVGNLAYQQTPATSRTSYSTAASSAFTTPRPNLGHEQERTLSGGDEMDWEPSQTRNYDFRTSTRDVQAPVQLRYPVTSAMSSQPSTEGPSPFYGTLPAAPKSMEAKLRGYAQAQPASFKPTSDAKQADWFKRMRLSQASWATKDYLVSESDPNKRVLELQDPKFRLDSFGLSSGSPSRGRGTGLEEIFGSSFKLDDDSPVKERTEEDVVPSDHTSIGIAPFMIAVVFAILSWYLLPSVQGMLGLDTANSTPIWRRVQDLGYGK